MLSVSIDAVIIKVYSMQKLEQLGVQKWIETAKEVRPDLSPCFYQSLIQLRLNFLR